MATPSTSIAAHPTGPKVGFIGLGNMGSVMATNLALALPQQSPPLPSLVVFNRTKSKVDAVQAQVKSQGGQVEVASSLRQVAQQCHIIFASLSDDEAVHSVFDQLCKADDELRRDSLHSVQGLHTIWVDLSTVSPSTTGAIELKVSSQPRRHFAAASAIGTPPEAKQKQILFAMAGAVRSKLAIRSLLVPSMGRKLIDLGGNHEAASTFKLITNSFVLGMIELLGETMTLADKSEVGAAKFVEFLQAFTPQSPEILEYARKILQSDFQHRQDGFSLEGGINNIGHIRNLAMSVDCPINVVDAANQHMIAARANASPHSRMDWSALVAGQRLSAGLDPWQGKRPGLERD